VSVVKREQSSEEFFMLLNELGRGDPRLAFGVPNATLQGLKGTPPGRGRGRRPEYPSLSTAPANEDYKSHAHFLGSACTEARLLLLDRAPKRRAEERRGFGQQPTQGMPPVNAKGAPDDWLILCGRPDRFNRTYRWSARIAEYLLLGGMSLDGMTVFLRAPMCAVKRDWRFAHPWYYGLLKPL
jgi:hypothetical protein